MNGARRRENELDGAYEPRSILIMTYSPKWDSNSVGQSSVLIKRRSRVQVPAVPPIFKERKVYKPLPSNLIVGPSKIDGLGVLATADIAAHTELGISHVVDKRFPNGYIRTPLGGFINHRNDPNCELIEEKDFLKIKTLKDINAGEELTLCYKLYSVKN